MIQDDSICYIQSINTTNHIRPKKQLHVSTLLLGHRQVVQYLWGDYVIGIGCYLGDEISSYIIILGVKAG